MIIKGKARGRAGQLAQHLLRTDQNERVEVFECRGTLAQDVEGALVELEARARAGRSGAPLYHASLSPEPSHPLTSDQIRQAVDLLEERLGFHGQPRVVVLHRKKGREHVHVVWSRIAAEAGNAIPVSWNYRVHEQVSRELEARFGHPSVRGSRKRPLEFERSTSDYELRQEERSGIPTSAIGIELSGLWHNAVSGEDFRRKLEEAGYRLARGDRRVFVVIDRAGNVHSLARRIHGATTADIRDKLKEIPMRHLPSVAEARSTVQKTQATSDLRSNFKRASWEVSGRKTHRVPRVGFGFRPSRADLRDMTAFFASGTPTVARPFRNITPGISPAYRSMRAALIAEYASRIAQAFRHLPPHKIDAAVAAIRSERTAALKALRLIQPNIGADKKGDRRRGARNALPLLMRRRLRFRRRLSPKH